jgi:pyridoxine kinase
MPVLSVCGHETCILPVAVLSTHTGGFQKPVVYNLTESAEQMWRHWQREGIRFDAVLTGYLGSVEAVSVAKEIIQELLEENGIVIVDPAMADHGKRYSGLTEEYAIAMAELCEMADILLPNLTEAAMLTGNPYQDVINENYVNELIRQLPNPCVVLTGIGYAPDETGVLVKKAEKLFHYGHKKLARSYHGTGDMFAAAFTGALLQEKTMEEAVKIAADFTCKSIENTWNAPAHWYGVKFETALPDLIRMLDL